MLLYHPNSATVPILWMCHSRLLHAQINRIHERALRIVHNDNISSFEQLLELSIKIHYRNLQLLALEIFKALNSLSSPLMFDLFQVKDIRYNLRKGKTLISNNIKTTSYGIDSISYLAPKIWNLIPEEIQNCKSLQNFKTNIRLWVPDKCPCNLCKVYVQNVRYI